MKMEHEVKLDGTEMSLIRWMCWFMSKEMKMQSQRIIETGSGTCLLGD